MDVSTMSLIPGSYSGWIGILVSVSVSDCASAWGLIRVVSQLGKTAKTACMDETSIWGAYLIMLCLTGYLFLLFLFLFLRVIWEDDGSRRLLSRFTGLYKEDVERF